MYISTRVYVTPSVLRCNYFFGCCNDKENVCTPPVVHTPNSWDSVTASHIGRTRDKKRRHARTERERGTEKGVCLRMRHGFSVNAVSSWCGVNVQRELVESRTATCSLVLFYIEDKKVCPARTEGCPVARAAVGFCAPVRAVANVAVWVSVAFTNVPPGHTVALD